MKALAIVALVFAGLSIFIPLGGIFIAMLCSIFALITFRSQPTLSGITFGINIINTAFLSPSILVAEAVNQGALMNEASAAATTTATTPSVYFFYVGFHIILFLIAIIYFFIRKQATPKAA